MTGVLDLSCLDAILVSSTEGKERFLPNRIVVRGYMQKTLKHHRLAYDERVTPFPADGPVNTRSRHQISLVRTIDEDSG